MLEYCPNEMTVGQLAEWSRNQVPVDELATAKKQIVLLREALDQLLDDMGADGHCVCEAAKQQAIEVFAATEPKP